MDLRISGQKRSSRSWALGATLIASKPLTSGKIGLSVAIGGHGKYDIAQEQLSTR